MKKEELQQTLADIYARMQRESSSKAFISNTEVGRWEVSIEALMSQINEFGVDAEDNYEENGIQYCGCCNQKVSKMKKSIDRIMLTGLIKAFNYVIQNRCQTFMISDIDLSTYEYANLNHLVRFGLLYKGEGLAHGEYGVPRKTVSKFMKGEWSVAKYFIQDPTKKEKKREMSEERILVHQIPSVQNLRKEFGDGLVSYEWNEEFE